jgi:hypothetical protein
MSGPGENPLKFDPELRGLLEKLDLVKSFRKFKRWKNSFLTRFDSFLEVDGIENAATSYTNFTKDMALFVKSLVKVENHVSKGELSATKKTVKAATAFREMCKELETAVAKTMNLIPTKIKEEKTLGYNKFQLGAVLVRDGFQEYERMIYIQDVLKVIGDTLGDVADKQDHELFDSYRNQVQRFCDIMADLGLYEVMLKCREFAEEPEDESSSSEEEEEPEPDPDPIIFVDMKSVSVFVVERAEAIEKGVLTEVNQFEYSEAAKDVVAKDKIKQDLTEHPELGISRQVVVQKTEVDDVDLAESAKVASVWGISLKKRPKNKKGEEFVFIDPKTNACGELARKKFIDQGFITLETNDEGKEVLHEAEKNNVEYENLIQEIRRIFNIKAN